MPEGARVHRWLAIVAGTLGTLAVPAGDPYPGDRHPARDASYVTPVEVARWIRDPKPRFRLVDVGPDSEFAAYRIPGAEHVPFVELSGREWPRDAVVVLYAKDDARAADGARLLRRHGVDTVHVLRGGLSAWVGQIAEPRLAPLPPTASAVEQAVRREHLELSRYFGGTPLVSPGALPVPGARPADAAAVARVLRRGC